MINNNLENKAEVYIKRKFQKGSSKSDIISDVGLLKYFPEEKIIEIINKVKADKRKSVFVGIRLIPEHFEYIKNNPSKMIREAIVNTYINKHGE